MLESPLLVKSVAVSSIFMETNTDLIMSISREDGMVFSP